MAFEASMKFFFMGYRAAKKFDDEYCVYLRNVRDKEGMLTSFYKSDLSKIFLDNGYAKYNGSQDEDGHETISFRKGGGRRVEIKDVKIFFSNNKDHGAEGGYDMDFHVQIEGAYGMDFADGKIKEGYDALNVLKDEVMGMLTNKLSKRPERAPEKDE